jgi:hypothetical protein
VWIELIYDYTLLSSKEPNNISYEEWRALGMDISVGAHSGLSVVLRSSCFACADCSACAYCLGDIDVAVVCSAVA